MEDRPLKAFLTRARESMARWGKERGGEGEFV